MLEKKEGVEQILTEIRSLKEGQQRNYDLIQKNGIKLEKIDSDIKAVAEGHEMIRREMREMGDGLRSEIGEVKNAVQFVSAKVDKAHDSLKKEIMFTAEAVKDELRGEIRDVGKKLDAHLRVPHAV